MIEKPNKLIWYIPAAILILGIFGLPYGYYIFLRIIVCLMAGYIAYTEYSAKSRWNRWAIIFASMAMLFNPLIIVFLSRLLWGFIDIFCAGLFILHFKKSLRILGVFIEKIG